MDLNLSDLYLCATARWSPQIGDPTLMGWLTVAAYFGTALACLRASRTRPQDRRFWLFLFVFLLLLGINKQFDLQSALTATGRCVAQMQGWSDRRREVQLQFIIGLLAVSSVVFLVVFGTMVRRLNRVGLALLGFGTVLTFVAVRAVGFHHVDDLIGMRIGGARVNWILELGGISLIAVNALAALRVRSRRA